MQSNDEQDRELKNAVFAAKAAAENTARSPQQSSPLDLEVPVEVVPLPSKGLVYSEDSPLFNQETIDIKAMTAKEENILMSRALVRKGTVITELLRSCLMDKRIDVDSMLSGDRNAIMVAIRITGYGSDYTTKVTCPGCDQTLDFTFDLSALPIRELDTTKVKQIKFGENLFEFTLPMSKKVVEFRFLTGKDEALILATIEGKKKRGLQNDEVVTTRLTSCVVSINGETDRNQITRFVSNMRAGDSLGLRNHIDSNEPSVDMSQEFTCNNCGHQEVLSIPLGISFFWPGRSG